MKYEPEHIVADIICAAGGRLVSRIRLQKIAYLIYKLGACTGFNYNYYHYGPYSSELDSAVLDAKAFDLVDEKDGFRESDGARYSIFELKDGKADRHCVVLKDDQLKDRVRDLAGYNITVLELAATAHWLSEVEKSPDWMNELQRRKGTKTADGRLEKALDLLGKIGLPPAVNAAR